MGTWPHAPIHRFDERGTYMITGGTFHKQHLFDTAEKRHLVLNALLDVFGANGWLLQAWVVLTNHYHVVAISPDAPATLPGLLKKLHGSTAVRVNSLDHTPGRKVWFQYWDTYITFQRSYLARLNYVNQNPVHHGVVANAIDYEWCSANWLAQCADPAFRKMVESFPTDEVNVLDDF